MRIVDEILLTDPGQEGPPWLWTGPGFPPGEAAQIRQKCARTLLDLQRRFCLSGDEIHALTAWTWSQLYRVPAPPWVEVVLSQLAWSAIKAPIAIRGRRIRLEHWIRYAAVTDHLRQQRKMGAKTPNKRLAYRDVSKALRGRLGRGAWKSIETSYIRVAKAVRSGKGGTYAHGVLDNRYDVDVLGHPLPEEYSHVTVVKRRRY
jgi:hypothetical protein